MRYANVVDDLEVGTRDYMDTVSKMNNIKNTFTNLDKQFNYKPSTSVFQGVSNFVKWYKDYYKI